MNNTKREMCEMRLQDVDKLNAMPKHLLLLPAKYVTFFSHEKKSRI